MYKHKSLPSVIYSYGASEPRTNLNVVNEQLLLAHRYWNTLVEIDRRRRQNSDELLARECPPLAAVEQQIAATEAEKQALDDEIGYRNARERRKRATADEQARMRDVKQRLAALYSERKALRATEFERLRPLLDEIEAQSKEEFKAAYRNSGLYWGTYNAINQSAKYMRKGAPPKFRRLGLRELPERGRVAIQLQNGRTVSEILRCENRILQIEPTADGEGYTTVRMRVGSENREPVWAEFGVKFHRPLPAAKIKWAYLHREQHGDDVEWKVSFVLSRESGWQKSDLKDSGAVGVDVGWRRLTGGLRVAYWVGSDGERGELILPTKDLRRWAKADELRSIRGREFDVAQAALIKWLSARSDVPEWLIEKTTALPLWKSTKRLEMVVAYWREHRFAGDEEVFPRMEAWRKQSKHLHDWELNQRRKAVNWRDDVYRKFAAKLRRRYNAIHVEDCDWSQLKRRKPRESNETDGGVKEYMDLASPGRLIQLLCETAATPIKVPAEYTTMRCHLCGELSGERDREQLYHTCTYCGESWDQDRNAAINLLNATEGEEQAASNAA